MTQNKWEEVDSSLFRGSGSNPISRAKIKKYAAAMEQSGWDRFPPIHGGISTIDETDIEDYEEAEAEGFAHELDYNRPIDQSDLGREYALIEDGHHRAFAAWLTEIPIRVKIWD